MISRITLYMWLSSIICSLPFCLQRPSNCVYFRCAVPLQVDTKVHIPALEISSAVTCHMMCRYVPMFGEVDFRPENAYSSVPVEEQMQALSKAVTAGKVRHIGLSNETAWGVTQFSHLGIL